MLKAAGIAFAVGLVATPLVRAAARRLGLLDIPGPRSSHQHPRPRAGGLAILVGMAAAALASGAHQAGDSSVLALAGGATLVAAVGLADDRFGVPAPLRLVVHLLAAALVVGAAGGLARLPLPAPLDLQIGSGPGSVLGVLWVAAVVNFYNFMDGIDGLATLQAVVTAGALALALAGNPSAALVAAALAAAAAAFLAYNWAPASVFLGDVGSGAVGYTLAALALLAPEGRQAEAVLLVGTSLFLFLADATTCLLGRMVRGERWHEAHRQHLYQRWVATGATHATVASSLGFGALVTTTVALVGWRTGMERWYWFSLALGSVLIAAERAVVTRREQRAGRASPADGSAD